MNPIDFINSKDVRAHLKKIGYKPGLLEAAYFIYHSYIKTLAEKEAAWKELIASTDDMILSKELNWRWERSAAEGKSVQALLDEHIKRTHEWLDYFYQDDVNAIYLITLYERDAPHPFYQGYSMSGSYMVDGAFVNYEVANKFVQHELEDREKGEVLHYSVTKQFIRQTPEDTFQRITVFYHLNGEPFWLEDYGFNIRWEDQRKTTLRHPEYFVDLIKRIEKLDIEIDFFGQMWFDIPIPFQKYDIVVETGNEYRGPSTPFELLDTDPWYRKNNTNPKLKREGFDESDMRAFGWTVGFPDEMTDINSDVDGYYLDLEYYRGDYKGLQRLLPVLVAHDKRKIDIWEYNILWQRIVAEHQAEKYKKSGAFESVNNKKKMGLIKGEPTYENDNCTGC